MKDKDPREEAFLAMMNAALAGFEEASYEDGPERYPTLHVIGVPRSGTTLVTQLLARHLDVGYVNNLIAAFWRAPTVGVRLTRKLLENRRPSSYSSRFGRTAAIEDPHEFGYFWRELLGYEDLSDKGAKFAETIDWHRVRVVLSNITYAFERPVVFKSFWLSMHIERTMAVLARTCFIRVRRDPIENALSLLRLRKASAGSEERWASMKPREYVGLQRCDVAHQVAGQVFFLQRMMDQGIDAVQGKNVLDVRYEDICADPRRFLRDVQALLAANGAAVELLTEPPESFEPNEPSRDADQGVVRAVASAFSDFEAGRVDVSNSDGCK